MDKNDKIYVAGHTGLVGSALLRALQARGYSQVLTRTHASLDLTNQASVDAFFEQEKPHYVFLAAAKVGGIWANNQYPADFIMHNLQIQNNVIHAAWKHSVKRLLFLGSSCIYPRDCPQPIREAYLLSGLLEPTNRPYAVAKIAGIEACWAFNRQFGTQYLAVMPTNLYGPGDHYDLNTSHVIPALIRKFHEAKMNGADTVKVWGTGKPRREFLFSDDLADACLFLMSLEPSRFSALFAHHEVSPIINVGTGTDQTIEELALLISKIVQFNGAICFDDSKPDGTPRKILCVERMSRLGWNSHLCLEDGLTLTYQDFLSRIGQQNNAKGIPCLTVNQF